MRRRTCGRSRSTPTSRCASTCCCSSRSSAMRDLLFRSRIFTYLAAATPGLKELVTIGKIWELALDDRKARGGRALRPGDRRRARRPATGSASCRRRGRSRTSPGSARSASRPRRSTRFIRDRKRDRDRGRRAARGDAGQRDRDARARRSTTEVGVEVDRIFCNGLYPERFDDGRGRADRRGRRRARAGGRAARLPRRRSPRAAAPAPSASSSPAWRRAARRR